jgi:hypothetical protein
MVLKIKTGLKAGRSGQNHTRRLVALAVKTGLKAGRLGANHNRRVI